MERRTRIPDDFKVSPEIMQLAKEHNWPDPNVELESFKDYHEARGNLMLSWEAAFRTWLRNSKKYADEKAQRVYTQDKPMVRSFADRKAMPVQSIPPAPMFTDKPNDDERARVADMLSKLTRKLSAGGKP